MGIEIRMKLSLLFVELPTIITTSLNQIEHSSEAQSSKGANNKTFSVTKQVRLVVKVQPIDINPDRWTTFEMDPVKKASIIAWLYDSPSSPDILMEKEEIIRLHRMILQYVDDEGVPSIEDTAFVSARTLLDNATTVAKQLEDLKKTFQKVSKA